MRILYFYVNQFVKWQINGGSTFIERDDHAITIHCLTVRLATLLDYVVMELKFITRPT
jgi:hypothetical protein